ncbi:retrovirus-related pol polyprotein from transposon TNT 1-94 [Tanacetum coccineum]
MSYHEEEDQALNVGGRGRGSYRGRGRGRGRGRSFNKATIECYNCHKLGHFSYECPSWKNDANYAEIDEKEEVLLMAHIELQGTRRGDVWLVDSGCSNHMCGQRNMFSSLDTSFTHNVKLGNNHKLIVVGKGVVKITLNGVSYVVNDVYYVPELKNNLLSVGQLQEKGLDVLFKGGDRRTCSIFHPSRGKIAESVMSANRMFILLGETSDKAREERCLQVDVANKEELWHHRYGHLSNKGLQILRNKEMVTGLPPIGQMKITCEACVKGKHHRVSFPKQSKWRSSEKLELIHSDLCGPITPPSNGQKRYLISFIDDFSRKTWIYFVVEKSEAFHIFKEFKARVEKQSGSFIKCLRTDRGGEYNSTEFKEFCKEHGIKRQLTTAYTPQQNGVAERKNRTIMNMVRAVLSEKEVPKSFWPDAVQWANHVLNRSPTTIVKDMTPEEAWSGSKPSVEHFRVFGCIGYVHVPDVKRTKLDDKSVKCVMIGYSSESKAFKMFDPVEKKAHVSRDVIFEEEKKWNWDDSYSSEQNLELEWEDEYECVENEIEDEEVESEELEDNENQNEEENADDSPSPTQIDIGAATSSRPEAATSSRPRRPPVWQADYTS